MVYIVPCSQLRYDWANEYWVTFGQQLFTLFRKLRLHPTTSWKPEGLISPDNKGFVRVGRDRLPLAASKRWWDHVRTAR